MDVVHGLVRGDGRLALWAESPRGLPVAAAPGAIEAGQVRPHPFAVAPPVDGPVEPLSLLLPGRGGGPAPSPELGVTAPGRVGRARQWTVPAVTLEPDVDPEALLVDVDGIRAGSSIGYLADVTAFAVDLVRRGRVLPGLALDGPRAHWQPLLRGLDQARFDQLRRSMPGVVQAGGGQAGVVQAGGGQAGGGQAGVVQAGGGQAGGGQAGGGQAGGGQAGVVHAGAGWSAEAALRAALGAQVDAMVRRRWPGPLLPAPAATPTAVTAWLDGLSGEPAPLVAEPAALRALAERLDAWQASGGTGAVRTCFRLSFVEEGDSDDEPAGWLLEFLLQPVADPSVLVPAAMVWADRAALLTQWVDYPQEVLLTDLARAGRLYPDLEDALRAARPDSLFLDVAGAYRFLTHAPLLAEAGFGVLLPARWQQPATVGLTLTVHSVQPASPVLRDRTANLGAIVDYRWGLAIGTEHLTEAELVELARAKQPLVRLRGRWVYLDRDQLAAGVAFLARGGTGRMTAGEALRAVRLWPDHGAPLPVSDVDGTGWVADLLAGRAAESLELLDQPASLRGTLRPYQRRGLSWLAFLDSLGIGALLADDMGLGKTIQLLALELLRRAEGPRPPTLIVCPLSVLGNWEREIERFAPGLSTLVHHGQARAGLGGADLVLTTYHLVTRDIDALAAVEWDRVVLDEAQNVKNATTLTGRAVRRLTARHRVALTGTPVENRLMELWSIVDFLNPGLFGPASIFRARYSVPVERYNDPDAAARLRRATQPYLLRRLKTDGAIIGDLPEKIERTQWCTLTAEQATLYRAVVDELREKLREPRSSARHKGLVLSAMTKLKQACNHPAQLLGDGSPVPGRSGKVARLEEILATALAEGDRALVFTQFVKFGAMLGPHLAARLGVEVGFLHGGLAKGPRDALVERFQGEGRPRVLLVSLKAGGTGLNLTAATHVVHLDRWWNPAAETQATDRAYRIGQRRDVQVHTFVCAGTIEERIDRMIAEKRDLAQLAVGSGEGWLTRLSTEDLLDLVRLDPEATDG